jgi:hypothetical protein
MPAGLCSLILPTLLAEKHVQSGGLLHKLCAGGWIAVLRAQEGVCCVEAGCTALSYMSNWLPECSDALYEAGAASFVLCLYKDTTLSGAAVQAAERALRAMVKRGTGTMANFGGATVSTVSEGVVNVLLVLTGPREGQTVICEGADGPESREVKRAVEKSLRASKTV